MQSYIRDYSDGAPEAAYALTTKVPKLSGAVKFILATFPSIFVVIKSGVVTKSFCTLTAPVSGPGGEGGGEGGEPEDSSFGANAVASSSEDSSAQRYFKFPCQMDLSEME